MRRKIRRWGVGRKERLAERGIRRLSKLIETRFLRLGYRESAADHISRLPLSDEAVDFLAQLYPTIGSLQAAVLTRRGFFRGGRRTDFRKRVMEEVLEALIEYYATNLRFLKETCRRLAKD